MEVKIVSIAGVPSLLSGTPSTSNAMSTRTAHGDDQQLRLFTLRSQDIWKKSLLWSSILASQVYMQIIPTPMRISIPMPLKCATKRTTTRTESSHSSSILGPHWISQLLSATGSPSQKLHNRLSSKTVILKNLPGSSIQLLRT